MNNDELITHTYHELVHRLAGKLADQHYTMVVAKDDDKAFNSRYTIWSNNADALKLLWDGKEELFVLTVTDDLPLSHLSAWHEIILVSFEQYSLLESENIISRIMASLE